MLKLKRSLPIGMFDAVLRNSAYLTSAIQANRVAIEMVQFLSGKKHGATANALMHLLSGGSMSLQNAAFFLR